MAIVVEQPQPQNRYKIFLSLTLIVILIVVIAYFFFFKKPPLIEIFIPPVAREFKAMTNIDLNPSSVLGSPVFKQLKNYTSPLSLPPLGRGNPFLAP